MSVPFRKWLAALLLLLLIVGLTAVTRLRLPAVQLDTVEVELIPQQAGSDKGRRLDAILAADVGALTADRELLQPLSQRSRIHSLRRFWIDSCEVNQRDYEEFLIWYQRRESSAPAIASRFEPPGWEYDTSSRGHRIAGLLKSPATGVSFFDAQAYCRAAGGRLPSGVEWQAAASGKENRLYPWGDEFIDSPWPYVDAELNASQRCGLHPQSDTPDGIHDLGGGAAEWSLGFQVSTQAGPMPTVHGAYRAQSFRLGALNSLYRRAEPTERDNRLGFRCVYPRRPQNQLPWGAAPAAVLIRGGEYWIGPVRDARIPRLAAVLDAASLRKLAAGMAGVGKRASQRIKVSRCEISRAHYRLFLSDPMVGLGLFANEVEPQQIDYTPLDWEKQLHKPSLPVTGINWWAADAYARWAGGRLPEAEEWDLIAGAGQLSRFPWGEQTAGQAVTGDRPDARIYACGAGGNDLNPAGIWDLGGNASEWSRSLTVENRNFAAWVKGGSYILPALSSEIGFGRAVPLQHRAVDIGLRVVFD